MSDIKILRNYSSEYYKSEFTVRENKISLSGPTISVLRVFDELNNEADEKSDRESLADRAIVLAKSVEDAQLVGRIAFKIAIVIALALTVALIAGAVFAGMALASTPLSPLVVGFLTALIAMPGIRGIELVLSLVGMLDKKKHQEEVEANLMKLGKLLKSSMPENAQDTLTKRIEMQEKSEQQLKNQASPEGLSLTKEQVAEKRKAYQSALKAYEPALKECSSLIECYKKVKEKNDMEKDIIAGKIPLPPPLPPSTIIGNLILSENKTASVTMYTI